MSDAVELIDKGIELFNQENYYDAMTNFNKVYNMTGNIHALLLSAKSSFQLSLVYLKVNDFNNFKTFSDNAISKYDLCVRYSDSSQVKQQAAEKIQEIQQLHREIDELRKRFNR